MIKVADIIEESQIGGPQIRMLSFASELSGNIDTTLIIPKKNCESFVVLCKKYNLKYKLIHINKVSKNIFLIIKYLFFFIYEINLLRLYFTSEKFDLIHVSGGAWQFKGVLAAKLSKIPVIWHINDTYMPKIIKLIFRSLSTLADTFIFASYRSKDYYKKYIKNNSPSFVIPATVDTGNFNPETYISKTIHQNGSNKIIIGTVANISPVKGIENIIKLAIKFKSEKNIEFRVIGNVPKTQIRYFKSLTKLIKKNKLSNVKFNEFNQDIRPFLSSIDIYLCTSHSESSPIAVWEAMSMKKPVVSNDVGDVSRHIKNHINGIVIKNNNITDIFNSLRLLIKDKQKRQEYGINARQTCKNYLETSVCANNQLKIFKEVVNNN